AVLAEMLLDLRDDVDRVARVTLVGHDPDRVVDFRQVPALELHVDHGADHLDDFADLLRRCCIYRCCHVRPVSQIPTTNSQLPSFMTSSRPVLRGRWELGRWELT